MKLLHGERREGCLVVIEILPLKDGYEREELRMEFFVLALAYFNHHSVKLER